MTAGASPHPASQVRPLPYRRSSASLNEVAPVPPSAISGPLPRVTPVPPSAISGPLPRVTPVPPSAISGPLPRVTPVPPSAISGPLPSVPGRRPVPVSHLVPAGSLAGGAERVRRAAPTARAKSVGWVAAHALVGVAPLAMCFLQSEPGRGFVVDLSVALGFVALSVLGLQFALAARFSRATAPFGIDAVLRYHKQISFLAVLAAFGHPVLLFLESEHYRRLLDVVHDPLRAKLAWLSVAALAVLMATSIWRRAMRISYPVWHVLHSVLGVVIVLAGLGHAFLVDYYLSEPWVRLTWALYAAGFLWLAVWVRLVKPIRLWRRAWRVVELWPEPGDSVTLGLEPAHRHGNHGLDFQAGQFAWILTRRTPFIPTYHPFSISSSALASRVEFTIKRVGQFTRAIGDLRVGDTVYLDGPHGGFTMERHPGMGYVFIAAGVGVTPFLSMLATLADQGDQRPCWLVLGNRHEDQVTGVRQLAKLAGRLDLRVVHVISRPSAAWAGERGRIDAALFDRVLPEHRRTLQYFICAREDMVRSVEEDLTGLGIPRDRVHSEQFGMV